MMKIAASAILGILLGCWASPDAARADQASDLGADQAAGLFLKACLPLTGNSGALRSFLAEKHVSRLTPEGEKIFVKQPGQGFDASNRAGRFAITSFDDGSCKVFAEHATAQKLIDIFEAQLRLSNEKFEIQKRNDDPHHRSFDRTYVVDVAGRKILAHIIVIDFVGLPFQAELMSSLDN